VDTYVDAIREIIVVTEDRATRALAEGGGRGLMLREGVGAAVNQSLPASGLYDAEGDWQTGFVFGVTTFGSNF